MTYADRIADSLMFWTPFTMETMAIWVGLPRVGDCTGPRGFGEFSQHLLIGNFGDGHINAFDAQSTNSDGPLKDLHHQPIIINGLWGLKFGGGAQNNVNGAANSLYFTAGIGDESHGLFGMITVFHGCDDL